MTSDEIRKKFIDFFLAKNHKKWPASSLVSDDPTTLFTTAGMQRFKKWFSGEEKPEAKRVVTIQPCLRTSDIDKVGDESHLTFFEMLGNFSFGDYFKKEAIEWSWEFLTDKKWLGIDKKRISATYFKGDKKQNLVPDEESLAVLKKLPGLEKEKIKGDSFEENFWSLGTEGSPGGPTVEFYVDDIEVWNLVFNEYIRRGDKWEDLKIKGVDTGMGLERLLVVLNREKDVFKTELFWPIIEKIEELSGKKYRDNEKRFRRIADHYRSVIALIGENILPGKNEREYTLRVLLRVIFLEINNIMQPIEKPTNPWQSIRETFHPWPQEITNLFSNCDIKVKEIVKKEYQNYLAMEKPGTVFFKKNLEKSVITGKDIFRGRDTFGLMPSGVLEIFKLFGKKISKNWEKEYKTAFDKHREISRAGVSGFKGGLVGESEITTKMHTATHLLLKALQIVLGKDVHQRGSNINPERIRFDFSYPKPMTDEEIKKVEEIVNQKIAENLSVQKREVTLKEAKKLGAEAQFVEKYGKYDKLTLYSIDDFSHELCGGPHVKSTGEIGKFRIIKEESSSAGVRRIKAKVG